MSSKHYNKNTRLIKTTDPNGNFVVDSCSNSTTFESDGTLTVNNNNGIITWNSGDITHLNFASDDFMILYDAESNIITLTTGDKSVYYNLEDLKNLIKEQGLTVEEMDKILEKGDKENGSKEES